MDNRKYGQQRSKDWGFQIGTLPPGEQNNLSDVPGVKVGHHTLKDGDVNTGVTAVIPAETNLFKNKLIGAAEVFNGFGKTTGLLQLNELGTLETPIILTNTFAIGTATDALIQYMLKQNPEVGRTTGTINPLIAECNDMLLNDIRQQSVQKDHVVHAISSASTTFKEGAIGAGTGMVSFGLKGGIGSASRRINLDYGNYHIGVFTLSNFGYIDHLTVNGNCIGPKVHKALKENTERGSVIMILATDLPVTHRQLKRIVRRTAIGLSRTGSIMGNGSGDIAIGFSTATKISHDSSNALQSIQCIPENDIDKAFLATVEATEEAVIHSLLLAETTTGRDDMKVYGLASQLKHINI